MFNRDSCRYLLSCLAFFEIHLSWLSKLSYHPLMFQQQDDSFRMVLPHFWHLRSVNWDHLRDLKMVFCSVANAELLSKRSNETGPDFFLMSFLLWRCNPTSMSPLPLVLHFPHLCCLWLFRCHYRLSTTLDYSGRKGKSWYKYSIRIDDTSCLPCWQKINK